jgi:hypothetical protein
MNPRRPSARVLYNRQRAPEFVDLKLREGRVERVFDICKMCIDALDLEIGQREQFFDKTFQIPESDTLAVRSCFHFKMHRARGAPGFRKLGKSSSDILSVHNLPKLAGNDEIQSFDSVCPRMATGLSIPRSRTARASSRLFTPSQSACCIATGATTSMPCP